MSSTHWPVAADTRGAAKPPLVLVSNMYPSERHPAYGLFVQRSADQMAPHFQMHYLTMPKTPSRVWRLWRYVKLNALIAGSLLLRRQALHVVHFPLFFAPALLLTPLVRTPLVLNFHGTDNLLNTPLKRGFGRLLKRATRHAHVVAPSAAFAAELRERYALRLEQMFVSPSAGVDTDCFHPVETVDRRICHVAFVSTLLEEKGWQDFLQVIEELAACTAPGSLRFSMVGSGPDEAQVATEIRARALPIERHPTLNHTQLAAFYQGLSVLLYPSRRESLGLTAIECLACGTPVIAQRIPGPDSYIVPGENGTLVAPGDTQAMREAVLEICALSDDDSELLRQRCTASVARYDSKRVGTDMVGFLRRVRTSRSQARAAESHASRQGR